jgi:hypothetical protein
VERYVDFGGEIYNAQHVVGEVLESSRFQEARTHGSVSGGSVHINGRYVNVSPPITTLNTKIDYVDQIWVRFPDGQDQEVTIVNANGQFLPGHEIVFSYLENQNKDLYLTSITNKNTMKIVKFYSDNSVSASVSPEYLDENKRKVKSGKLRFWFWLLTMEVVCLLYMLVSFRNLENVLILNVIGLGFISYTIIKANLYSHVINAPLNAAHNKYVSHFDKIFPDIVFNYIRQMKTEAMKT